MKKVTFAFLAGMFLACLLPQAFALAQATAGMQINEIMYNLKTGSDSGREWVEVFNSSATPIDMSKYTLFENDTNHKMVLKQGSSIIPTGGYAVIVDDATKFKVDWPNFTGVIFDSTFSLSNTGEALAIKNTSGNISVVVDQVTYSSTQGGAGDGNSLGKINGVWQSTTPTPGAENEPAPVVVPPSATTPSSTSSASSKSVSTSKKYEVQNMIPPTANFNYGAPADPGTPTTPQHTDNSFFLIAVIIIFLGFSAGAIYSMRKSGSKSTAGDDFDILDE